MAKEYEEKTSFITSQGIFCYSKVPFGLKNAGATYQWLVDKAFRKQIGRNLEVYMDDLVIKCRTKADVMPDIEEAFKTLREINMKVNPKICTFGIEKGMFLGYKVNTQGIKVCPDKVQAVLSLPFPKFLKDVLKLNGKLASLNHFLAKLAERSVPFFKTLKKCTKKSDFEWTEEAEAAFKQMKVLIAELPTLTAPREKEELVTYLAAAEVAVSAFLMTKREAKQMSIYFVSRALRGMIQYLEKVLTLASNFKKFLIKQVPRSENKKADALSKIASTSFTHLTKQVLVEELEEKSINETEVLAVVKEEGNTWMTLVYEYLIKEILTTEKNKARAVRCKSRSMHVDPRSVVAKAIQTGYYWLTMHVDARKMIRECQDFQVRPTEEIISDNEKHFRDNPFKDWCEKVEEIPHVLWAHRTMIKSSNGDTPFSLTYGTEAVIPAEIGMPTLRTTEIDMVQNDDALGINLDLLAEKNEQAAVREAKK
ncbi:reverse transcriptase domain-containing protein [Tanacetum coccineum]